MKPIIPFSILDELESLARLKTQSLPPEKLQPFWRDVTDLKLLVNAQRKCRRARWAGSGTKQWQNVKNTLDKAMDDMDFDYLDAFVEAWTKTGNPKWDGPGAMHVTFPGGDQEPVTLLCPSIPDHDPRSPVTVKVIESIKSIQRIKNRIPTRTEILDEMHKRQLPIDAAQLLTQLKKTELLGYFEE
jgi:hypothetical protein